MEVYAIKLPRIIPTVHFDQLLNFVSLSQSERINRFVREKDAYRTLLGEVLIRSIVCQKLNKKNKEIYFIFNEYKKPYLHNHSSFFFNISHSGDWVVCVIDQMEIGIDIEKIQSIDLELANSFFSLKEYNLLISITNYRQKLDFFYELWTLKESYIKAIGKGLSIPLDSFSIIKDTSQFQLESQYFSENWYFKQYEIDQQHKLSICAKNIDFPSKIIFKDLSTLLKEIKT